MRNLPEIPLPQRPRGLSFEALAVLDPRFTVRAETDAAVISIFAPIGGEEVSDARVAAALRQIGPRPVTVEINSPGGDFFSGLAIYNLLRRHPGPVSVQVLGVAASAAAIIAMAGTTVAMARASQLMIHTSRGLAIGDRNALREFADLLERLDASMAGVFATRSGLDAKQVSGMLDAETWLDADEAMELGFADALLDREAEPITATATTAPASKREFETRLRSVGLSKGQALRVAATAWPALRGKDDAPPPSLDLDRIAARLKAQAGEFQRLTERTLP